MKSYYQEIYWSKHEDALFSQFLENKLSKFERFNKIMILQTKDDENKKRDFSFNILIKGTVFPKSL